MAMDREFGKVPEEIKKARVTMENYDLKVEWYGTAMRQWKNNWPFLSHDKEPATADETAWDHYFCDHLGGYPQSYATFRNGRIKYYNVPETRPELFDLTYHPTVVYVTPPRSAGKQFEIKSLEQRSQIAKRILGDLAAAFASPENQIYNVFVPTFAPQYPNMVARGGRPGVSLEDKTRTGVWVPHEWLIGSRREAKTPTWKQFTAVELLAKYPPTS